jgi:hypothetical protein
MELEYVVVSQKRFDGFLTLLLEVPDLQSEVLGHYLPSTVRLRPSDPSLRDFLKRRPREQVHSAILRLSKQPKIDHGLSISVSAEHISRRPIHCL